MFTAGPYVPPMSVPQDPPSRLSRSLGMRGAVVVGISSMIGTGVFAVWEPAIERAGSWLLVAVAIAAVVAALNATSTARLARLNPEAGGVYAYGRIHVNRFAGVIAGVVFIVGKTASASAAALTIGLYVWPEQSRAVALAAVLVVLIVNLRGVVRSVRVAGIMVCAVALILAVFVGGSAVSMVDRRVDPGPLETNPSGLAVVSAGALIFVAFAGYARITVLGEEVRDPARVIPRAIAWSFILVLAGYLAVASVVLAAVVRGVAIGEAALVDVARSLLPPWMVVAVVVAAVMAAGAVLLSLIAGVGRTMFAMANRGDAPRVFAAVGRTSAIPNRAEIAAAVGAALLVSVGGLTLALALSAVMILTYYGIGHLAALRIPAKPGLLGFALRTVPVVGFLGCMSLVGAVLALG